VFHQDRFSGPIRIMKMGVHDLFINVWFGNGADRARLDILDDILSKFRPI